MLKAVFGAHVFADADSAPAKTPTSPAPPPPAGTSLDIKQAIDSHVRWRQRLEDFIRGNSFEQLSAETVGAPDRCDLGKWIHGAGRSAYGHLDLFTDLETAHTRLHEQSGAIVESALAGRREQALERLQAVEYSRATAKVKNLLAKIYIEVLCAQNPVPGHVDPHPPATHRR